MQATINPRHIEFCKRTVVFRISTKCRIYNFTAVEVKLQHFHSVSKFSPDIDFQMQGFASMFTCQKQINDFRNPKWYVIELKCNTAFKQKLFILP